MADLAVRTARRNLPWEDKSDRSKREEVAAFCNELKTLPKDKVIRAVIKLLKETGDKEVSKVIKSAWENRDQTPTKKCKFDGSVVKPLSNIDALAMVLDSNLTKFQYNMIREKINVTGSKILPCYDRVTSAKAECRPDPDAVIITEKSATVSVQALLNHTSSRIVLLAYDYILENLSRQQRSTETLTMTCCYGYDGSSGQSNFKQKYSSDINASPQDDSSLFVTTLVPLLLANGDGTQYWRNKTPQSIRYCRPIRMLFAKESKKLVCEEQENLRSQIDGLQNLIIVLAEGVSVEIRFEMVLSMIDGKILAMTTGTPSSMSCPICGANPTDFNNLDNLYQPKFEAKDGALLHGVSPLHTWIRFLEFLLHLSYRLPFKTWQIKAQYKEVAKARKEAIQTRLWKEMSLRVDFPCSGGSGTSNDGNSARRAFADYEKFAEILEIDQKLVFDLRTILIAFGSQQPINPFKFDRHCYQILYRYTYMYPWFYLPASVHKILTHGGDIIRASPVPVGMMGEEGAESRNKIYRNDREHHSRKMNRVVTMQDMFYRAIDTSDPVLSYGSQTERQSMRKRKPLPQDVLDLLYPLEANIPCPSEDHGDFELYFDAEFCEVLNEIVLEDPNETSDLL